MDDILKKQQQFISDFSKFSDWEAKYAHIIKLGKLLPPLDNKHKTPVNLIKGCQSQVWLQAELQGDKIIFSADSDALIVRGLVAILIQVFSGQSCATIINANVDFLKEIGLTNQLTPSRANGLANMIKQFKNYAIAFNVLLNTQK